MKINSAQNMPMTPADALRILMDAGHTQVQLAKELDVSPSSLSKILTGVSPKWETGVALVAMGKRTAAQQKRKENSRANANSR